VLCAPSPPLSAPHSYRRLACCPACGSYQVLPYAIITGCREEYGYHCQSCQITWRVLGHDK
jgi:hypothetical protein